MYLVVHAFNISINIFNVYNYETREKPERGHDGSKPQNAARTTAL